MNRESFTCELVLNTRKLDESHRKAARRYFVSTVNRHPEIPITEFLHDDDFLFDCLHETIDPKRYELKLFGFIDGNRRHVRCSRGEECHYVQNPQEKRYYEGYYLYALDTKHFYCDQCVFRLEFNVHQFLLRKELRFFVTQLRKLL